MATGIHCNLSITTYHTIIIKQLPIVFLIDSLSPVGRTEGPLTAYFADKIWDFVRWEIRMLYEVLLHSSDPT